MSDYRLLALMCLALVVPPACLGGDMLVGAPAHTVLVGSGTIGPAGGTVAVTDPLSPAFGTQVVIPAGALAANKHITIRQITSGGPYDTEVLTYEFGPDETTFALPVTVTLKYKQAYLDNHGVTDESILRILQTPLTLPSQVLVTSAQDTVNDTISGNTTHFSMFAALLYTNETLKGDYLYRTWAYDHTAVQGLAPSMGNPLPCPKGYVATWGSIYFDGKGTFYNGIAYKLYDQTFYDWVPGPTGYYWVDSRGVVTFNSGILNTSGNVLAGGKALLYRTSVAAENVQFGVAVRQEASATLATLSGDYSFVALAYDSLPPQPAAPAAGQPLPAAWPQGTFSNWGTMNFDGAGNMSVPTKFEKYDGVLTGPFAGPTGTYVVGPGPFLGGGGMFGIVGAIAVGGDVILFHNQVAGSPIQIGMGIRKAGSFTNADIAGSFAFQTISFDLLVSQGLTPSPGLSMPRPKGFFCDYGTISFDGSGNAAASGKEKIDQHIAALNSPPGTYTVATDGTLTLAGFGGPGATGFVLLGGQVLLWVDHTAGGVEQIAMAIRK